MWIINRIKKIDLLLLNVALSLFIINNYVKADINIAYLGYLLKNHFNDFLGGIAFLAYINAILSMKKGKRLRINGINHCLILMFFVGLIWEYITPLYCSSSTADPLDILAYCLGGVVYGLLNKRFQKQIC